MTNSDTRAWLLPAQSAQVQTKWMVEKALSTGTIDPRAAAAHMKASKATAPRGRGRDKRQRCRRSKKQLQVQQEQKLQHATAADSRPAGARLPTKARPRSNNKGAPPCMPTSSLTSRSSLPATHLHVLPDEQRTAEMQQLQETMPGYQWVPVHPLQQIVDTKREEIARWETMPGQQWVPVHPLQHMVDIKRENIARMGALPRQHIVTRNRRGKGRRRRQALKSARRAVVIKTESVDGNPETRPDSAYGIATNFASTSPPKTASIIAKCPWANCMRCTH